MNQDEQDVKRRELEERKRQLEAKRRQLQMQRQDEVLFHRRFLLNTAGCRRFLPCRRKEKRIG